MQCGQEENTHVIPIEMRGNRKNARKRRLVSLRQPVLQPRLTVGWSVLR